MDAVRATRNHYLAMAALGLGLGGLVSLVDPGIASAVALPVAFFAAQSAGAKFATLAGRALTRAEALPLAGLAVLLQVSVGAAGIALSILTGSGQTVAIHYDMIALVLAAAALLSFLVTLAGLGFGARITLRRKAGTAD
jgi:hypothetical protein